MTETRLIADRPIALSTAPAALAAGLMSCDRYRLLPVYLILVAPSLLETFLPAYDPAVTLALTAAQRFLEMSFLFVVSSWWLWRLTGRKRTPGGLAFVRMLVVGYSLWALTFLPPAILAGLTGLNPSGPAASAVFVLFFVPGVFISYSCFMYFFPLLFAGQRLATAIPSAVAFFRQDRYLPLRTLVVPAGITSLLLSLCSAPYPDGRLLSMEILGDAFSGIFWMLSCYLSLAYGLLMLNDRDWRELDLDPYRDARCATISMQAAPFFTRFLRPASGVRLLLVSIFVWAGNFLRIEMIPPSPAVTLQSASAQQDEVTLQLQVVDRNYRFRGFQPIHLRLAGERYLESATDPATLVCPVPESVSSDSLPGKDLLLHLPQSADPVTLTVKFRCNRKGQALTALQDLNLWYRRVKLAGVRLDAQ